MKTFTAHYNIPVKGKHVKPVLIDAFVPSEGDSFPVVIFSHGFKGFKDWGPFNLVAEYFASRGFIFIKFNFSWNGTTVENPSEFNDLEAFGNNNFTKELDDLETVIDWVIHGKNKLKADTQKISLVGHSRGGGITILKAAEDDRIFSLVTWAAVADFSRFITNQDIIKWKDQGVHFVENSRTGQLMPLYLQLYDDYVYNIQRFHIRAAAARLNKPLLVIHGTHDETVPVSQADELHLENPGMVTVVKLEGGDHNFGAAHPFNDTSLPPLFQQVVETTHHFLISL